MFYEHRGVSLPGIFRAAIRNVTAGEVSQGGSTISQQYVKNVTADNQTEGLSIGTASRSGPPVPGSAGVNSRSVRPVHRISTVRSADRAGREVQPRLTFNECSE